MATKPPTIQQLVDIIAEYNKAREMELRSKPALGWPESYKNPFMDNLYEAATGAAALLKPAVIIPVHPPQ